jgi:hypothetical protein
MLMLRSTSGKTCPNIIILDLPPREHTVLWDEALLEEHLIACRGAGVSHLQGEEFFLLASLANSDNDLITFLLDFDLTLHRCSHRVEPLLACDLLLFHQLLGHVASNSYLKCVTSRDLVSRTKVYDTGVCGNENLLRV